MWSKNQRHHRAKSTVESKKSVLLRSRGPLKCDLVLGLDYVGLSIRHLLASSQRGQETFVSISTKLVNQYSVIVTL